jgi:hypothetical protein
MASAILATRRPGTRTVATLPFRPIHHRDGAARPTTSTGCCDGDIGGNGPFCSGGSLSCATGFGLYFGADCTRECGPCAIACPDSGTSGGGAEGGGDASHD